MAARRAKLKVMARTFLILLAAAGFLPAEEPAASAKDRIRWIRNSPRQGAASIPALDNYLRNDPDGQVRSEAVKALIEIGGPPTLDALVLACADKDSEVQARATDGLVNLYVPGYYKSGFAASLKRAGAGIKGRFSDDNGLVIDPGVKVDPKAQEAVAHLVKNGTWPEVRANAARAAGILRARPAAQNLGAALSARDTQLILESLTAIEKIGDPSVAPLANPLINDLNEKVQITAIGVAAVLRERSAAGPLRRAMENTRSAKVRATALEAIAMIPDESNRALFDAHFADKDGDLRAGAAEGLGRLGNKQDLARLQQAFDTETQMRPRLAQAFALVRLGKIDLNETSPLQYLVNTLNSSAYNGIAQPFLIELARDKAVRGALEPGMEQRTAREKTALAEVFARNR
ncbi:MAG: hypothetical protein FJW37_15735 [Acidobacteria bacterium]|nr:hypothetical protein [Acidobacteriota bacterium]